MALKDWYEIMKERFEQDWSKEDGSDSVNVSRYALSLGRMRWYVDIKRRKRIVSFKTKKQALTYAKNYMRKH